MRSINAFGVLAAVVVAPALAAPAAAETVNCTPITSLPYTISGQGVYCLTGDLSTAINTGSAIEVAASNVVLDLNGHKIGGLAAGPGTSAYGVHSYDQQNVTVRNGTIRGFFYGIWLTGASNFAASQGHLVERIRADQNTFAGIIVGARASLVRKCQVVATGGTTTQGPNVNAYGILVFGPGHRVINNDVATVAKQGAGISYAIAAASAMDALIVNNRLTDAEFGVYYNNLAAGKYRSNLTRNIATPYSGGTNLGNNN